MWLSVMPASSPAADHPGHGVVWWTPSRVWLGHVPGWTSASRLCPPSQSWSTWSWQLMGASAVCLRLRHNNHCYGILSHDGVCFQCNINTTNSFILQMCNITYIMWNKAMCLKSHFSVKLNFMFNRFLFVYVVK